MSKVVVIGAGIAGLTTASMLAKTGHEAILLEAHNYPGGCAGTFRRKGYRFEAGATLAGGFYKGEIMDRLGKNLNIKWRAKFSDPAVSVHLPSNQVIRRYGDKRRWGEREKTFGNKTLEFWRWQEKTADVFWDLAGRAPAFPPQNTFEFGSLINMGIKWLSGNFSKLSPFMIHDAFTRLGNRIREYPVEFRRFIDAQLLISAQTISHYANNLFSAAALDLPRRGIVHLEEGIGTMAWQIAAAFEELGGTLHYRQRVRKIIEHKKGVRVETEKGLLLDSDILVANLTPWDLRRIMPKAPYKIQKLPKRPPGWGAFTVYLGIDEKVLPSNLYPHHQVIGDGPMAEGNTIYITTSPEWDESRAPSGKRAITISTHSSFAKWWSLINHDHAVYEQLKERYIHSILNLASRVVPKIRQADIVGAGTPVTFQHFTGRHSGWVGGYPQETLFKTFGPKVSERIWLVGDSIFPGQSTVAVSLGGMRVARSVLNQLNS